MDAWREAATWINWLNLAGCGGYSAFYNLMKFSLHDPTKLVLSAYLCIFGVAGALTEFKVLSMMKRFPFLLSLTGKGFFFLFCGTLGLSFGWETDPGERIIPFLMGLISIAAAVIMFICKCIKKQKTPAERMADAILAEAAPIVTVAAAAASAAPNKL